MIKTPDLIASLAANATPVRRLRPPAMRAACWLLLAATVLTLLAISQGVRPDLAQRLREPAFALSMAASLLTGVLAAITAFLVSLPDRSRLWLLLPIPALVVWFSNIGYQCLVQWIAIGPDGISLGEAARCFSTLVLTGLPLSLAMLVMLRHAAPLRPTAIILVWGLICQEDRSGLRGVSAGAAVAGRSTGRRSTTRSQAAACGSADCGAQRLGKT